MRLRPGMTVTAMAMLLPFGAGAADGTAAKPKPMTTAPKAVVTPDFLEYLATLEGEDDNWTDFEVVVERPPAKAPKAAAPKAAKAESR